MGANVRIEDLMAPYVFLSAEILNEYLDFVRALLKFLKKEDEDIMSARIYPLEKHGIKYLSAVVEDKSGKTIYYTIFRDQHEYNDFEFREALQNFNEYAYYEYMAYKKLPDALDEVLKIERENEASKTIKYIDVDKNFYSIVREK